MILFLIAKDLTLEEIDLLWADEEFKQAYRENLTIAAKDEKFDHKSEKDAVV
jgi:hypothetical protein